MTAQRRSTRPSERDDHPTDVFRRDDYGHDGQDVADEWEQALRGDDEPAPARPRREDSARQLTRRPPAEDRAEAYEDDSDSFADDFAAAAEPRAEAPAAEAPAVEADDEDDEDRPTQVFAAIRDEPRGGGSIYSASRYPAQTEASAPGGLFEDFRPAGAAPAQEQEQPEDTAPETATRTASDVVADEDDEDRYETAVIPRITDEPAEERPAPADPEATAEWVMSPEDLADDPEPAAEAPEDPAAAAPERDPEVENASTVLIPRISGSDGEPELLSGNRADPTDPADSVAPGLAAPGTKPDKKAVREARKAERAARRSAGRTESPVAPPQSATPPRKATPGAPEATTRRRRPVLLVTVLALLTLVGSAGAYYNHEQTREALRYKPSSNLAFIDPAVTAQVREQVSRAVEAVYSYDAATLDQSEQRALSFVSGGYVDEFKRNFAMVRQLGPRQKASLTSTVSEAGLENLTERRATLLVMVNQKGRRADTPQELRATVRLNVTAERVDGQWKVTGIEQR